MLKAGAILKNLNYFCGTSVWFIVFYVFSMMKLTISNFRLSVSQVQAHIKNNASQQCFQLIILHTVCLLSFANKTFTISKKCEFSKGISTLLNKQACKWTYLATLNNTIYDSWCVPSNAGRIYKRNPNSALIVLADALALNDTSQSENTMAMIDYNVNNIIQLFSLSMIPKDRPLSDVFREWWWWIWFICVICEWDTMLIQPMCILLRLIISRRYD